MHAITDTLSTPDPEFSVSAIRSSGAGGQNVNNVATAIQLRFDIPSSSLPDNVKQRLMLIADQRVTKDGVLVIKSMEHRSQERNYQAALDRLVEFIRKGTMSRKKRLATKPSRAAKQRRLDSKVRRGTIKTNRGKVTDF